MSPDPDPGLMPIGRLARLSRLSPKALRLYAAGGLLEPAWVDPDSGYRYYRREQVATATTIALLRSLDVPLPAIRRVLDAPDDGALSSVLAEERDRLARDLAAREQALRSIERLARAPEAVRYDVSLASRPVRRLAGVSGLVRADRLGPDTGALCGHAIAIASTAGLPVREGLVATFPLDLDDAFEVCVGVPVERHDAVPPGTVAWELEAGTWASTLHVGSYEALALAYAALFEHLRERGHEPIGPIVETYLNDPTTVPPAELLTRLSVRV